MIRYVNAVMHSMGIRNEKYELLDEGSILVIKVRVPDKDFDLLAAAKAASLEYCKTEKGKEYFCMEKERFNWGSFAYDLPQAFCEKHGFEILDVYKFSGQIVDWQDSLASIEAVYGLNDEED